MADIWVHQMVDALEKVGKKTGRIFNAYMGYTGLSKAQLYKKAKAAGWKPFSVKKENESRRKLYGK